MSPLGTLVIVLVLVGVAVAAFWMGVRHTRRRTAALMGAAQDFCLRNCRLPDGRCPLLRFDMRREDCPLWRFVEAGFPTDLPVDADAPLGAGPYRNPPVSGATDSR